MTTPETEKYKNIINKDWRAEAERTTPDFFIRHPRMTPENRAKVFAPFAALRGHGERLSQETGKLLRTNRVELSEEGAAILSCKIRQLKRGMEVTVVYFEPDPFDEDTGYETFLTGTVDEIDIVNRTIKIKTDGKSDKGDIIKSVKFDNLLDMSSFLLSDSPE